jgi:outer membrane immunogenic protein
MKSTTAVMTFNVLLCVGASAVTTEARADSAAPMSFNWTGPYVGVDFGGMFGKTRVVDTGFLVEPGASTDGVLGGVLAGFNWQDGAWVYGIEGDASWASVSGHGVVSSPEPLHYAMHWAANGRLRVGYTVAPETLVFVAGGLAVTDLRFTEIDFIGKTRWGWTIGAGLEEAFSDCLVGRIEFLYADYGRVTYTQGPFDFYQVNFSAPEVRAALVWKL